jgi:phosphoesterase RecJ-like protein
LWGFGYNKAVAEALLTGIVTDTIGFRTSNVTPDALHLSAMLMEYGANLPMLYTRALVSKTFEAARYWGLGLGKLQQETVRAAQASQENGDTARVLSWTTLTLADRQEAGYPGNDDADLVNMLSAVEGDVAVIFVEQKNGHVKVSWRAQPGIDVSQIALQFGGGGHAAAAGADIPGSLEQIQAQVLGATRALLARQLSDNDKGKPPVQA